MKNYFISDVLSFSNEIITKKFNSIFDNITQEYIVIDTNDIYDLLNTFQTRYIQKDIDEILAFLEKVNSEIVIKD